MAEQRSTSRGVRRSWPFLITAVFLIACAALLNLLNKPAKPDEGLSSHRTATSHQDATATPRPRIQPRKSTNSTTADLSTSKAKPLATAPAPSLLQPPLLNSPKASSSPKVEIRHSAGAEGAPVTMSGRVLFLGTPPQWQPSERKAECSTNYEYVVSGHGGLANVFVYIKKGLEKYEFSVPSEPVAIRLNPTCLLYEPYMVGIQLNQPLLMTNLGRNNHGQIRSSSNEIFQWSDVRPDDELALTFDQVDVFATLFCKATDWQWGYVAIVPHPYFAVTDGNGAFKLPADIPIGNYVIAAHHPKAGEQVCFLSVQPGEYALEFTFLGSQ